MGVFILRKLNEDHENQLPAELLNMTVGEMLTKVGELDTNGDAEYEIIEDALKAINDKILGTGYENDEVDFTPEGVEGGDAEDEDKDPLEQQIETYDEISGQQDLGQSQTGDTGGMDNFEF